MKKFELILSSSLIILGLCLQYPKMHTDSEAPVNSGASCIQADFQTDVQNSGSPESELEANNFEISEPIWKIELRPLDPHSERIIILLE